MTDQTDPLAEVQGKIKSLEWKIRCAREALGEGEELPLLAYTGAEIVIDGDAIVVPLSSPRAPARLTMSAAVATDLAENISSVLHARRCAAIAKVRELHVRQMQDDRYEDTAYCDHDGESWPCPTIVALQGEGSE